VGSLFPNAGVQPLPIHCRVAGNFHDADSLPVVVEVFVNGSPVGTGAPLSPVVVQSLSSGGAPIPGVYHVDTNLSSLSGGDILELVAEASIGGLVQRIRQIFKVYESVSGPAPVVDPLLSLGDDFDDSSIDPEWDVDPSTGVVVEDSNGLVFRPADEPFNGSNAAWGNDTTGPIVSKEVTGDFRVTATARITNIANDGLPPLGGFDFLLAGLIVRDPSSPLVNSFHAAIGSFNNAFTAEVKSTDDDQSTNYADDALTSGATTGVDTPGFEIVPATGATFIEATFRICRVGQLFTANISFDGGASWSMTQSLDRGSGIPHPGGVAAAVPFGATVDVGMMAYNARTSPADFEAQFQEISYETIGAGFASACT